jgi:hypothetical protein
MSTYETSVGKQQQGFAQACARRCVTPLPQASPCHKPAQYLWRQMEDVNFLEGNLLEASDAGSYCPLYTRTCRLNTRTSMHSTRGRESGGVRARHAGVVLRVGV